MLASSQDRIELWKRERQRRANILWNNYIENAATTVFTLMDAKIANDIAESHKLPEIIISPFATNNTTEKKHGAIYIRKSQVNRFIARTLYSDAYSMIINRPFRCTRIQEAYFALFASIFALAHSNTKIIGATGYAFSDEQARIFNISQAGRQAIMHAVNDCFKERFSEIMLLGFQDKDDFRIRAADILLNALKLDILETFYLDGTFGLLRTHYRPDSIPELDALTPEGVFGPVYLDPEEFLKCNQ
jgi:hypothetical protein